MNSMGPFGSRQHLDNLKRFWLVETVRHPILYIEYKLYSAAYFMFNQDIPLNSTERIRMAPLYLYTKWFTENSFELLFNRLLYFMASFGLLLYALCKKTLRHRPFILALAASSLLYYVPYLLGSLTADYRFTYWNIFAVWTCLILVYLQGIQERAKR